MAAVVAGRMVVRPDLINTDTLHTFVRWSIDAIHASLDSNSSNNVFLLPGVLLSVATIFKLGNRQLLIPTALAVLPPTISLLESRCAASNALVRKLTVKLIQRACLMFLPQRVAPWRYSKENTAPPPTTTLEQQQQEAEEDEDDVYAVLEDEVYAEAVESCVETMLRTLGDSDTVVRWSSAKGLGRIAGRLPKELGDEVVASVLSSFSTPTSSINDSQWHGGCLALAELTRRGLLLPPRLSHTLPIVMQALEYDVRRGHCSVGAHVRDAAAYVCWAVGRAYASQELGPAVAVLAPALMTTACYDREVNCRRAAAAAFQECVGRLGSFPHGIDILTAADYFTVSLKQGAFLSVGPYVASFPGYFIPLARHLLTAKLCHWEKSLRELTAVALAKLVPIQREFFLQEALPYLLSAILGTGTGSTTTMEGRHGAVAAIAELVLALSLQGPLPPDLQSKIATILPVLYAKKATRGKGGEVLRSAVCRLIETEAKAGIAMDEAQKDCVYDILFENLHHPSADIQKAASTGLAFFLEQYYGDDNAVMISSVVNRLLDEVKPGMHGTHGVSARRGAAVALGVVGSVGISSLIPETGKEAVLPPWHKALVLGLAEALRVEDDPQVRDVETRVNAATGVGAAVAGAAQGWYDANTLQFSVLEPLIAALEDYSTDNRGDIGSWVREASMKSMHAVLTHYRPLLPVLLPLALRALALFARQSVERIGRVRETAGVLLQQLSKVLVEVAVEGVGVVEQDASSPVRYATHLTTIAEVTGSLSGEDFATCHTSLKRLASSLLFIDFTREHVLEGLAFSIGGLDAQLAETASEALVDALSLSSQNGHDTSNMLGIGDLFVAVWQRHCRSSRMALPLLTTAELLLNRTDVVSNSSNAVGILESILALTQAEIEGCRDVARLHAGAATLCAVASASSFLSVSPTFSSSRPSRSLTNKALSGAVKLIGNRYPKVRRYAAEQVYTTLLAWDEEYHGTDTDGGGRDVDAALDILSETAWDGSSDMVRPAQRTLLEYLGLHSRM